LAGPVYIPKIYDGRNKTFFYFTAERFNNATSGPGGLNWSVPQPEMFQGNLSRLLTGRQVGTDALGRPVMEGQIYDPSTLKQVNGRYIADPFAGNIIPPIASPTWLRRTQAFSTNGTSRRPPRC
jgi:hypothetical protein